MMLWTLPILAATVSAGVLPSGAETRAAGDACSKIAPATNGLYSNPADALACLKSFPVNQTVKANVLAVVSGALDFFTFEAQQILAPFPFQESSVNLRKELSRIAATNYPTDYDFNKDLYNVVHSLNDGHTLWLPSCYWSAFQNIIPAPIVSLASSKTGIQNVYIAPDAVDFVNALGTNYTSYYDSIGFNWKQYAGALVLTIGGQEAYSYVDKIASTVSGNYIDHGVRVNSVFSSYRLSGGAWSQRLGDLAGPVFPEQTSLTFTLIKNGSLIPETVSFPYRSSYIAKAAFTDGPSYWAANCAVKPTTNGIDYLSLGSSTKRDADAPRRKRPIGTIAEAKAAEGIALPGPNVPTAANPVNGDVVKSYILPNSTVGVLMIGSFSPKSYVGFQQNVVDSINALKSAGVTKVIVDVTQNGGGYICLGEFLHLALVGSWFGYGGFQTTHRANPLAQKIVPAQIARGVTPQDSFYAPGEYAFVNGTELANNYNYMKPTLPFSANGVSQPTGQRLLDICTPFDVTLPTNAPFSPQNIVIVSNGNCASTCAQFTTVMHERHGTRMVVFGGKPAEVLEFKGMAGNQVLEWADLDSEIKTALLKNDTLAPPDLLISGNIRINWRIAYSWLSQSSPIQFFSEPATYRYPYTADIVHNPQKLWTFVASKLF